MPYAFRSCAAAWLKTGPTPFCGEDMRWRVVHGVWCMGCGAWGAVHGVGAWGVASTTGLQPRSHMVRLRVRVRARVRVRVRVRVKGEGEG